MRKSSTPAFNAQIVQDVLTQEKTVAQLAAGHQLHLNHISRRRDSPAGSRISAPIGKSQRMPRMSGPSTPWMPSLAR